MLSLSTIAALAGVLLLVHGETFLVQWGELDALGPMTPHQAALLAGLGLVAISLLTVLLTVFPGHPAPDANPPAPQAPSGTPGQEQAGATHTPLDGPEDARLLIAAMNQTLLGLRRDLADATARALAAEEEVTRLQGVVQAYREGTAPEVVALRRTLELQVRTEVGAQLIELTHRSSRLISSLRAAHDHEVRAHRRTRAAAANIETEAAQQGPAAA